MTRLIQPIDEPARAPISTLLAFGLPLTATGLWLAPRWVLALRALGGPAIDYRFGAADQLGALGRGGAVALGAVIGLVVIRALTGSADSAPRLRGRWLGLLTVAALRLAGSLLIVGLARMAAAASGFPEPAALVQFAAIGLWASMSAAALPLAALGRPPGTALAQSLNWAGHHPLSAGLLVAAEWLPGWAVWARLGASQPALPQADRLAGLPLAIWDPGADPALIGPAGALGLAVAFGVWMAVAGLMARRFWRPGPPLAPSA